jgi:hypothetical protein
MNETSTFSADAVLPDKHTVFANQGIPTQQRAREETESLYARALSLLSRLALPKGVASQISKTDFADVYQGEGRNEPSTPVGDMFGQAHSLALFAVTIGPEIGSEIDRLFGSNDFALGCMLDSAASAAADRLSDIAERHYIETRSTKEHTSRDMTVMRYSPGYCGWHISGQKKLFKFLDPGQIGISLGESFLMQPLKSVSGVIIAGPREIHDFQDSYPFCSECQGHDCRQRLRARLAQ